MKDTPDLALKLLKWGWGVFQAAVLWVVFNLPFCLFDHTWDIPLSKIKFVCFIYVQRQELKFTSVQINMKQVSYHIPYLYLSISDDIICYICTYIHNITYIFI